MLRTDLNSMTRIFQIIAKTIIAGLLISGLNAVADFADNWPQWRGPENNGVSRTAEPPVEWSEEKNVQWKITVPGNGSSSPIVWGNKVFLLTAINTEKVDPSLPKAEDQPRRVFDITHPNTSYIFKTLCLDRNTGEEIWSRVATEKIPHEGHHKDNNFASASPVTDGNQLICWFGSAGLYSYDLEGNLSWRRDLGETQMGASLGEGGSPVLHKGRVVIVRDHQRQSYIESLDARTGKTLWKKQRNEDNSWATPAIIHHSGITQIIVPGSENIISYDLNSGDIVWQCGGLTDNPIPSPIIHGNLVVCMTGYKGHAALAIRLDSQGDVTGSEKIVWSIDRGTPYVPSPLLYDDLLFYSQSSQARWSSVDAKTGTVYVDRKPLKGLFGVYASPVAANGIVFVTDRNGKTLVLKHDKEFRVLATNKLEDSFHASPALVGNQIFLRGRRFLYCLSERKVAK